MNEAPELIGIELIEANPFQVRQAEDPVAVAEMAENIQRNGLLQPPTVRASPPAPLQNKDGSGEGNRIYELAFGHTRLAAFKLLLGQGKDEYQLMPCFVRDLDDLQMFELAVAENIKRRELNPVERARAMQTYLDKFRKTSAETGEFFSCDEATVRGTVRLLDLPAAALEKLSSGEITVGTARKMLILVRVAPDLIEDAVRLVIAGVLPDTVIQESLDGLAYHNKAIKMWDGWRTGAPCGGPGLWELDTPTSKFAKYLQPLSVLGDVDMRLAKKALEGEELTAQNRPQLIKWTNQLHSGLVAAAALIAQGAPADVIERLDQLIHPPACTACPFYVRAQNNHYCTWKTCHTRKKEAWSSLELEKEEKELNIKSLTTDEARSGYVVLDRSWDAAQTALVKAKDPDLRLRIKPGQYQHAFTGSDIVELVTVAPKAVEENKAERCRRSRGPGGDG